MKRIPLKYLLPAGPVFLGLLTFLYFKTQELNSNEQERFQYDLRQLKQVNSTLDQDVLKARFHLLNDYDAFSEDIRRMEEIIADLNNVPAFVKGPERAALTGESRRFSALIEDKRRLLEAFETHNAVLNNSLQYFPVAGNDFAKRLAADGDAPDLAGVFNDLVQQVLVYSVTSNEEMAPEIQATLEKVRGWRSLHPDHPEAPFLRTLIPHVQSIISRKPKVDDLTRALLDLPAATLCEDYDHAWTRALAGASRTASAYRRLLYIFCVLLVGGIVFALFALHSANRHLDRRVQERTRALSESNDALQTEVAERKRAQAELTEAQKEVVEKSRMAGMAEVATGVLHNVGNVLNSVNVSVLLLLENLGRSKVPDLNRIVDLLRSHERDLGNYLTADPKGQKTLAFLVQVADRLSKERLGYIEEVRCLEKNITHIKDIVAMQQSYARVSGVMEGVKITDLIEDSLRINAASLIRHDIEVVRDLADVAPLNLDRNKVLQILINLLRNAKSACDDTARMDKQIMVRVRNGGETVRISVTDNGIGIPQQNLERIFNHGFTTKKDGHGFGLHSGALAAKQLGGSLTVHSEGTGRGATFTLELPCSRL